MMLKLNAESLVFCNIVFLSPAAADFYVSPSGNDAGDGSIGQPFATLEKARDMLRASTPQGDVTVWIRGGTYVLDSTVVFTPADGGNQTRSVTYSAYPGETPVFTSARPLTGWTKSTQLPTYTPSSLQGKIWEASFPSEVEFELCTPKLYSQGRFIPRTRSDGIKLTGVGKSKTEFSFPDTTIREWDNLTDVDILFRRFPWSEGFVSLKTVNPETKTAVLITNHIEPIIPHYPSYAENIPEGLAKAGTWMYDSKIKKVYYRTADDQAPDPTTSISYFLELVRFQGDNNPDKHVTNLHLRGLTFTNNSSMRWYPNRKVIINSHEWETFDMANAAVRLIGAEECSIENCTFIRLGSSGVRLDAHAVRNRIHHSLIDSVGGIGVSLVGRMPGNGHGNDLNEVSYNEIKHVGLIWRFSPGIFLYQASYTNILSNHVHHVPYSGIVLFGNRPTAKAGPEARINEITMQDNRIAHNEVHHMMEQMLDGNGIYLSATGPRNVVEYNRIHDGNRANAGIRTDDYQYGSKVDNNWVYRIPHGEGIIHKETNSYTNNVLVDCYGKGSISTRSPRPIVGTTVRRTIMYQSQSKVLFPGWAAPFWGEHNNSKVEEMDTDSNLFWCVSNPDIGHKVLAKLKKIGKEMHSIVADPLFVDYSKDDFRLKSNSPARALGIASLDSVGLLGEAGIPSTPKPHSRAAAAELERFTIETP